MHVRHGAAELSTQGAGMHARPATAVHEFTQTNRNHPWRAAKEGGAVGGGEEFHGDFHSASPAALNLQRERDREKERERGM